MLNEIKFKIKHLGKNTILDEALWKQHQCKQCLGYIEEGKMHAGCVRKLTLDEVCQIIERDYIPKNEAILKGKTAVKIKL